VGDSGHAEVVDDNELEADDLYEDEEESRPPRGSWLSGRALIRMAIAGLVLVVGAVFLVSYVQGSDTSTPSDSSAAAGFARDMIDHHAQGVNMASIIEGRTQDAAVRQVATDIVLTQTNQMGQMQGWLNLWGLPIGRTGQPMQWMQGHAAEHQLSGLTSDQTHVSAAGLMPGMATQAQINQLSTLPTKQADILFLQLMIKHHEGGIAMAQAVTELTDQKVVVALGKNIITSQQAEITVMESMLKERGASVS
jgi:uncharacterized protein (DUF305 family)